MLEGVLIRLGSEWDYWDLAVGDVLDAGEPVVAMWRYQAKNATTGQEMNAQFEHVRTLRNGKAVAFQHYADSHQVSAATAEA